MTTLLSLLAACKEAPRDDAVRLILADWLEENGDESERDRAAYLRAERAYGPLPRYHADEARLLAEMYRLLLRNEERWLGPILAGLKPRRVELQRGLIDVEVQPTKFRAWWKQAATDPAFAWLGGVALNGWEDSRAAELAVLSDARCGAFAHLHLDDLSWDAVAWQRLGEHDLPFRPRSFRAPGRPGKALGAALAATPFLSDVRTLDLRCGNNELDSAALVEIAEAPWLAGVRTLSLWGDGVDALGMHALCASPHLGPLERLDLSCNPIGDAGASALAACPQLATLRYLSLRRTRLGLAGIQALAKSPHLRRLEVLELGENAFGDAGLEQLVDSPLLANVHTLTLGHNTLKETGIVALANAATVAGLRELSLARCRLSAPAATALAQAPHLRQLRTLALCGSRLDNGALAALCAGLESVTTLDLSEATIGVNGVRALLHAAGLPALTSLALTPPGDSTAHARILAGSALLRRLRRLWLPGYLLDEAGTTGLCQLLDVGNLEDLELPSCDLDASAARRLAACPGLAKLVRLDLRQATGIDRDTLRALLTAPHATKLALLDLWDCQVGPAIAALAEAELPALTWLDLDSNRITKQLGRHVAAFRQARPAVYVHLGVCNYDNGERTDRLWSLGPHDWAE